jgi:hypothetical protein
LKSKISKISSVFPLIPNQRNFFEFLFKFCFESGEVSIRKVATYLKLFPAIFYLEFLEPSRSTF